MELNTLLRLTPLFMWIIFCQTPFDSIFLWNFVSIFLRGLYFFLAYLCFETSVMLPYIMSWEAFLLLMSKGNVISASSFHVC